MWEVTIPIETISQPVAQGEVTRRRWRPRLECRWNTRFLLAGSLVKCLSDNMKIRIWPIKYNVEPSVNATVRLLCVTLLPFTNSVILSDRVSILIFQAEEMLCENQERGVERKRWRW